ncbi:MAG: hypothetical protein JJ953_13370 [Gracilimonas sp.]|uniref:hypothetical protein n=1 Tax=Gracilimonas TaxID=649462 RepID=UPI001B01BF88|nr:hypothetical protein [Gracilimonas sp.]MBO6587093.1 hypothetical protein [Gracilimonas sp.]MBO6614419.1 hypothetical protein [Gracilimonas sp.]
MRKHSLILILCLYLFSTFEVYAQDQLKPTSFQNLALQFTGSDITASSSPVMPSVANAYGHGSYMDNPASMALMPNSEFSLSFYQQNASTESYYLGNSVDSEAAINRLGNIGLTYSLPTLEGSMVIGVGYSRVISENRSFGFSGRNSDNTITDSFLDEGNEFHDLAFDTYAIDWGDVDRTYLESIFRIGFEPGTFPGINQDGKISSETLSGEYSAFFATEFRRNLFIGISAGYMLGDFNYERSFLEIDSRNDYDGDFIEGSDIDNILVRNQLDSEFSGWIFRGGAVYKFNGGINAGISYVLPSTFDISELFYYSIQTSLDDNSEPFFSEIEPSGSFRYRIKKPGILRVGVDYEIKKWIRLAASAEYIDYSKVSFDFVSDRDARLTDIEFWRNEQQRQNNFAENNNKAVLNVKVGAELSINENMKGSLGYSYLPGKSELEYSDAHEFSGVFSVGLLNNLQLNVRGSYLLKENQTTLYNFIDFDNEAQTSKFTADVQRFRVMAGLKLQF